MEDMAKFRITYDGLALDRSEMDVRELAPALLAVGELLETSASLLYGDSTKAQTKVVGSFRKGCFGIEFNFVGVWDQIASLLTGKDTTAALNLLAVIGFSYGVKNSLIKAIKWVKNRKLTKIEREDNNVILFIDNESFDIEENVYNLLTNLDVRRKMEGIVSPLTRDGIDTLYITENETEIVNQISKNEAGWFHAPTNIEETLILDETRTMSFSIVSLAFKEDNKWRLSDGNAIFSVSILDEDFIKQVDSNLISFAKGDILVCEIRIQQWQTVKGARTEYDVIQVIEHRKSPRQISLL